MNEQNLKKVELKIHGTHCASCEILIERKFQKIDGVCKAHVDHVSGKAEVHCSRLIAPEIFEERIRADGYRVRHWGEHGANAEISAKKNSRRDYIEMGAIFLILFGVYQYLKFFDFLPQGLGIGENMSYGFVFLIGLVAAVSSCIAVTGGLLLAVAAKYNELHPNLSSQQRFRPHLYFNIGRVVGYAVFGGAVGALGSILTFSPRAGGILTILASLVMIILGFQLLHLFPWTRKLAPKMPKWISHKIHDLQVSEKRSAPFILGALTFFLPCGFTQALQLYVLSKGDMTSGALIMFVFSLGTLPALISLSAISSFARGTAQRYFLKFAGVVVLTLGFWNIQSGLTLSGISFNVGGTEGVSEVSAKDSLVETTNGKQIVNMKVNGLQYTPLRFTVKQGVPVEWRIDGSRAAGCAQVITVPKMNITERLLRDKETLITFTPTEVGEIRFSCAMGMTDPRAAFVVVP